MNFYKLRTSEHRIGIVGLYAAGKTVFLTSLINHLKDHDPDRFRLGDYAATVRKFQELAPDAGWERFPYQRHRDAIVHAGSWPGKTKDRFQYACTFERSDWRLSDAKLKLYDLPGERIADAMMASRDYAGWSDHVLSLLDNDRGYRECSGEFLDLLHAKKLEPAALLTAYKRTLARLILAYKPNISPSTFLLDTQGRRNKAGTPESMADAFHAGLEPAAELAPLSSEARRSAPELTASFAQHYQAYKHQVVLPLIGTLKSCHALVVLVDVLMLLAGGVGMYDDNRQVLLDLLDVLDPGESPLEHLLRGAADIFLPHDWRPGWITRIAFVAPKLDQVWPDDRDYMIALLKRMAEKPARDRDGLVPLFTNCSAVVSTDKFAAEDGQRWLRGVPLWDAASGKKLPRGEAQKFRVSTLPQDWPPQWPAGVFAFPDVYPRMPPRKDCPPDQVNLDKILDFVLD